MHDPFDLLALPLVFWFRPVLFSCLVLAFGFGPAFVVVPGFWSLFPGSGFASGFLFFAFSPLSFLHFFGFSGFGFLALFLALALALACFWLPFPLVSFLFFYIFGFTIKWPNRPAGECPFNSNAMAENLTA
jgi:hypothetical protein